MCCFISAKRVIPFAIAFALGLLVVSGFSSFFGSKKVANNNQRSLTVVRDNGKSSCKDRMRASGERDVNSDEIFLSVPPPPPPPPVAPEAPAAPEAPKTVR